SEYKIYVDSLKLMTSVFPFACIHRNHAAPRHSDSGAAKLPPASDEPGHSRQELPAVTMPGHRHSLEPPRSISSRDKRAGRVEGSLEPDRFPAAWCGASGVLLHSGPGEHLRDRPAASERERAYYRDLLALGGPE